VTINPPDREANAMHLYAVYLGGHMGEGRLGEDHEVVFVVGADGDDARRKARAKWSGVGTAHVDALQRLDQVDGHEVTLLDHGADAGDRMVLDTTPPSQDTTARKREMKPS
jgi:hypothetical protein